MQTSYSRRLGKSLLDGNRGGTTIYTQRQIKETQNLKMFNVGDDFPQKTGITGTSAHPVQINETPGENVQQKK